MLFSTRMAHVVIARSQTVHNIRGYGARAITRALGLGGLRSKETRMYRRYRRCKQNRMIRHAATPPRRHTATLFISQLARQAEFSQDDIELAWRGRGCTVRGRAG